MSGIISEQLALIITAVGGGAAVTQLENLAKSSEDQAVASARATSAIAAQQAATDKLAASTAKAAALQAGGGTVVKGSDEAAAATAAQQTYAQSKAASAVASDQLALAELNAKNATAGLGAAASNGGGFLSALGLGADGAAAGIAGAAAAIGPLALAVGGLTVLKSGISNFESLTDAIRAFQQVTGATASQASLLVGQVNAVGGSTQAVATALTRFGASIGDGTTKLGNYGIATAHLANGNVDVVQTFQNLRDAYNATSDAATKDALSKLLSLRGGQALIPVLNETAQAQQQINAATNAAGANLSQNQVNQGLALKEATNELSQAWKSIEITLAEGVIPDLTKILQLATPIVDAFNAADKALNSSGISQILDPVVALANGYDDLTGKTNNHTAAQNAANTAAAQAVTDIAAQDKAVTDLSNSVISLFNAQQQVTTSAHDLATAQQNQVSAQTALQKLIQAGPVDETAVANAKDTLTSSTNSLTKALQGQQNAENALATAEKGATALELAEASQKVADSAAKITDAQAAVQTAQENLDTLQGSGTASAGTLAQAQAAVVDAVNGVTDAQLAAQQATVDLTTTQQKGTALDPAVVSAKQSVADAAGSVTDAVNSQAKAEAALRTAEAGDPDFSDKLAAARQAVASAQWAVSQAQTAQMSSAYNLKSATDALDDSLGTNADQINAVTTALANFPGYENVLSAAENALADEGGQVPPRVAAKPPQVHPGSGNAGAPPGFSGNAGTPPGFASGGDATGRFLVGEHGTEILDLGNRHATVTPHNRIGDSGGVQRNQIEQHFHGQMSAADAARELAWTLSNLPPPPRPYAQAA